MDIDTGTALDLAQAAFARGDRALMAQCPGLTDHSQALDSFADTAAIVDRMDLVSRIREARHVATGLSIRFTRRIAKATRFALLCDRILVISVDTALVHVAGALGKPVWTMLPLGAEYRWRTEDASTPWYPSMRLFRQPGLHDWASVVAALQSALDRAE